tara:strand:+ start:5090 stop:5599 length:510 start_codon:yes stop_codon:yes gene_type:complete
MEFKELVSTLKDFNKCDIEHYNDILNNANNTSNSENKKQLNEFNWRMRIRNYREKIHNEQIGRQQKEFKIIETLDDIQAIMDKHDKNKKWHKLDLYTKKKLIREYVAALYSKKVLITSDTDSECQFLYTQLHKKKINKSKDVDYNIKAQKILNIPLLGKKFNKDLIIKI